MAIRSSSGSNIIAEDISDIERERKKVEPGQRRIKIIFLVGGRSY